MLNFQNIGVSRNAHGHARGYYHDIAFFDYAGLFGAVYGVREQQVGILLHHAQNRYNAPA